MTAVWQWLRKFSCQVLNWQRDLYSPLGCRIKRSLLEIGICWFSENGQNMLCLELKISEHELFGRRTESPWSMTKKEGRQSQVNITTICIWTLLENIRANWCEELCFCTTSPAYSHLLFRQRTSALPNSIKHYVFRIRLRAVFLFEIWNNMETDTEAMKKPNRLWGTT